VTFSFDDFPRSAYTVGGNILKSFGASGTFYVAYNLMNSKDPCLGDQFTVDDLHALVSDRHELASHTYNHVSSRAVSAIDFKAEAISGREAMQRIPGLEVTDNFAYPFGDVTAKTKRMIGNEMRSCRGIYRGVNGPIIDLNLLRANPLYGGLEQLERVRSLLQLNEEIGGWLIFYTHDVSHTHSRYGCTPALLKAAVELTLARSMKILTVNQVLETC
jgi:peptidoglycan/xylan/chitin deacetylase (PgdA/CDA1 family)